MKLHRAWLVLLLCLLSVSYAGAQGCSQCREAVGQSPAAVQRGYRRGILCMVIAAGTLGTASALTLRRFR